MSRHGKKTAVFGAVLALGLTAALLTATFASGQTGGSGSFNGLVSGGNLLAHFSNLSDSKNPQTSWFRQQDVTGGPYTEFINNPTGSATTFTTPPELMRVSALDTKGAASSVGAETAGGLFVGLGVAAKSGNGTDNGRVDFVASAGKSEQLIFTLGSGLQPTANLLVTAAELDLDVKGTNAVVIADLYKDSVKVGTVKLFTSNSDSGPDAGVKDNFAFPLNPHVPADCATAETTGNAKVCGTFASFNKIVLYSGSNPPAGSSATNTSFAFEGGPRSGGALDPTSQYQWDTTKLRHTLGTTDSVFSLQQSDGILNCADQIPGDIAGPGLGGSRGLYNKDGSPCVPVAYDVQNEISTNNLFRLLWDTSSQPAATFSTTTTWQPEDQTAGPDGGPIPSKTTYVDWGGPAGEIPAPTCTSTALPAPYGTLGSGLNSGDTTITLSGFTPRTAPFNLQIGNETFTVTGSGTGGATYTISWPLGATTNSYGAGTTVMTTPFPIITTGPSAPYLAQMCIWKTNWVVVDQISTINNLPMIQVTDSIFTEGDAAGKRI